MNFIYFTHYLFKMDVFSVFVSFKTVCSSMFVAVLSNKITSKIKVFVDIMCILIHTCMHICKIFIYNISYINIYIYIHVHLCIIYIIHIHSTHLNDVNNNFYFECD